MRFTRLLLTVLLGLATAGNAAFAAPGVEHYFKKPEFAGFQVSPNGKELAALAPVNNRMNIVVIDLATRKARVVTSIDSQDVNNVTWANNERLLFQMDIDGSESFGLFAVNSDGSMLRTLAEPAQAQIGSGSSVVRTTFILDLLDHDPDNILVTNNERRAAHPDVYLMNINTGFKKLVERNPGNVQGWFTDWDGEIRGAVFQDELVQGFLVKNRKTGEWEEVHRARYDEHSFAPVAITGDGVNGYVSSYVTPEGKARDKAAIYEYNFETRTFGDLVFEHDVVDVGAVQQSEKREDIVAVLFQVGLPEIVYVDEDWRAIMAGVDQALPETTNRMTSVDDEETIGIVTAFSSNQPPIYYLYDFQKNSMEFLAESRPWVKPEEMAVVRPITFEARDGLSLHGYLTLPHGSDGKNLPTVVNPHGGPWARDGWGYNPELQFLASRGYAVIQVNFRGSTGFGMEHWLKSRKQWGQSMQNDVTDALMWAVDQGISDPDRVCIYGGSYGGYATMAGLTYTPDLYKCGVNYVGVTDLPLLFRTAPDAWAGGMEQMYDLVGNPKEEREFLEEWSPSNHADRIKAPVFMAYGLTDPRVNIRHARVMEDALKDNDVPFELMVKTDEGHGYQKQENQYDFYGRMETFLAEHLNP